MSEMQKKGVVTVTLLLLVCSLQYTGSLGQDDIKSQAITKEPFIQSDISNIVTIYNPYEDVDFEYISHYKANLHTHTTESDGTSTPSEVIYHYQRNGSYDILAITDHNKNTWPWSDWISETPIASSFSSEYYPSLSMLAISGNEMSLGHHRGSLLSDFSFGGFFYRFAFWYIQKQEGLSLFYHPGRYTHTADWYNSFVDSYTTCIVGIEVYNQGDRYTNDRILWDQINKDRAPDDLIWGFSNDDMHRIRSHAFRNYQHFLMSNLSEESFKKAMIHGSFYFSYEPNGSQMGNYGYGVAKTPKVRDVSINNAIITLEIENATDIQWLNENSEIISNAFFINVSDINSNFVRAVLINEYGKTYLQPFGLKG